MQFEADRGPDHPQITDHTFAPSTQIPNGVWRLSGGHNATDKPPFCQAWDRRQGLRDRNSPFATAQTCSTEAQQKSQQPHPLQRHESSGRISGENSIFDAYANSRFAAVDADLPEIFCLELLNILHGCTLLCIWSQQPDVQLARSKKGCLHFRQCWLSPNFLRCSRSQGPIPRPSSKLNSRCKVLSKMEPSC